MNWTQVLANVAGVLVLCLGGHAAIGGSITAALSGTSVTGAALCVLANLAGLFQRSPAVSTSALRQRP